MYFFGVGGYPRRPPTQYHVLCRFSVIITALFLPLGWIYDVHSWTMEK